MKKNLVLTGMMSVGKSTIGKKLAMKLKYEFVDTDKIIEIKEKSTIKEIFKDKGENYFREIEKKITLEKLKKRNLVIALGGGAFIDELIRKEIISIGEYKYEVEFSVDNNKKAVDIKYDGNKIFSPIEGRVFFTKDPTETPIKINDIVKKGDILCYIESMKVINAIKSEFSGKIVKICFNDGDEIFDDDDLFIISK